MIEVEQLRKQYGNLTAVHDVSFTARPGEIFGLLGPNGAGKTTTIGCISSLLTPTSGHIRVMGHDVVRDGVAARKSGILLHDHFFSSSMPCMILISALWVLVTSVAKSNNTGSWPAPGVLKRSSTMVSAPV